MARERFALLAGFFLGSFAWNVCWPFLPLRVQEIGVGGLAEVARVSGFLAGGSQLITAFLAPWWSLLGERFGYRGQIIRAHIGMGTAMAAMGLARIPLELVGAGVMLGALGGNYPHYMALAAMRVAPQDVGRAIGDLQAAGQLGGTLGPLFGGFVASQFGVSAAFFASLAISFASAVMVMLVVGPDNRSARTRAAGGSIRAALADPRQRWLMVLLVVGDSSIQGLRTLIPVVIASRIGENPSMVAAVTGLVSTLVTGSGILSTIVLGRLSGRAHPRAILRVTIPITCLLAAAIPFATGLPELIVTWTLLGVTSAALAPCVFGWLGRYSTSGGGFALLASTSMLGFAIGPALMGQLTVYGMEWPFRGAAISAAVAAALVMARREPAV